MFALNQVLESFQKVDVQHDGRKARRKKIKKAEGSQEKQLADAIAAAWEDNTNFDFYTAVAGLKKPKHFTEDKEQASDRPTSTEQGIGHHISSEEEHPTTTQANSNQNDADEGVTNQVDMEADTIIIQGDNNEDPDIKEETADAEAEADNTNKAAENEADVDNARLYINQIFH